MAVCSKGGSRYENYDCTSSSYDNGRQPIGVQLIIEAFGYSAQKLGRSLEKLHVLDAGCGTGNFSKALSPFVGSITGLDFSEGMLEKAKKKTEQLGNVELQRGDITNMPFPSEHFAGITMNQVIHHLSGPNEDFSNAMLFLKEAHRVLVPNGALVISSSSRDQLSGAIWYYSDIIPNAKERLILRYPPIDFLTSALVEVGFSVGGVHSVHDFYMKPELYHDKEGPFELSWRNLDSVWALATPAELEAGLEEWREKLQSGEADRIIAEHDEQRKKLGLSTVIVAYKKPVCA